MMSEINLMSFGYKYGAPDANYVFDVSFLKNPARERRWSFWAPVDAAMQHWIIGQEEYDLFKEAVMPLLVFLSNTDADVRVAFGCSAGRHRSVIVVNLLAKALHDCQVNVRIKHREHGKTRDEFSLYTGESRPARLS